MTFVPLTIGSKTYVVMTKSRQSFKLHTSGGSCAARQCQRMLWLSPHFIDLLDARLTFWTSSKSKIWFTACPPFHDMCWLPYTHRHIQLLLAVLYVICSTGWRVSRPSRCSWPPSELTVKQNFTPRSNAVVSSMKEHPLNLSLWFSQALGIFRLFFPSSNGAVKHNN